ncbi:MAG TPA: FabA/FabZ family ACP-dehydratase [Ignavibacteriaceae bacterium]|nr:FabA/FabZ family ACP-dehydratase [Ignavibacteriaceae bacterium]
MSPKEIIPLLPYDDPFLFVDSLFEINENGAEGKHTFHKEDFFYNGHFKDNPVTPGVILIETMAQIGLVCLGIYLFKDRIAAKEYPKIALVSSQVDFFLPVYPGETVIVTSRKIYFRFGKLKCNVEMKNEMGEIVCKGILSGMITNKLSG